MAQIVVRSIYGKRFERISIQIGTSQLSFLLVTYARAMKLGSVFSEITDKIILVRLSIIANITLLVNQFQRIISAQFPHSLPILYFDRRWGQLLGNCWQRIKTARKIKFFHIIMIIYNSKLTNEW